MGQHVDARLDPPGPSAGGYGSAFRYLEWERFTGRVQESVDEGQLQEFVADAAAPIEALVNELTGCGCPGEDADWVGGRGRRSRTAWDI